MCSTFNCPRNEFVNGSVVDSSLLNSSPHTKPRRENSKSRGGAFGLAWDDIEFLLFGRWFSYGDSLADY